MSRKVPAAHYFRRAGRQPSESIHARGSNPTLLPSLHVYIL